MTDLFTSANADRKREEYFNDVRDRNLKLTIQRTFIESNGTNVQTRIIYTGPLTCTHEIFERAGRDYKCRGCQGIITEKQIYIPQ